MSICWRRRIWDHQQSMRATEASHVTPRVVWRRERGATWNRVYAGAAIPYSRQKWYHDGGAGCHHRWLPSLGAPLCAQLLQHRCRWSTASEMFEDQDSDSSHFAVPPYPFSSWWWHFHWQVWRLEVCLNVMVHLEWLLAIYVCTDLAWLCFVMWDMDGWVQVVIGTATLWYCYYSPNKEARSPFLVFQEVPRCAHAMFTPRSRATSRLCAASSNAHTEPSLMPWRHPPVLCCRNTIIPPSLPFFCSISRTFWNK